jgi:hypothetical protein
VSSEGQIAGDHHHPAAPPLEALAMNRTLRERVALALINARRRS